MTSWRGSRWERGVEGLWNKSARDSMHWTTGSEGGSVVDWEVRCGLEVLREVVPLRVKVELLAAPRGVSSSF